MFSHLGGLGKPESNGNKENRCMTLRKKKFHIHLH